ncbi:PRD domain-containing protein [Lentibacillus salinarum]
MIIVRIMNNNAVVALDNNENEVVLLGKGIAFQKKPKQHVNPDKVEKKFVLQSSNELHYLEELIRSIPLSYITVTNEIVQKAQELLEADIKEDSLFITLVDHIAFAIERKKSDDYLKNPLLIEIQKFYSNEYKVGSIALDIIEKHTGVRLDEDEAGYIAFNIINATLKAGSSDVKEVTVVIKHLISIIESHYQLELKINSVYYIRFITHLKYFLYRLFSNEENSNDEYLYKVAKKKFQNEYDCAKKIATFLKEKYNFSVSNEELGYLMIHINSMILHNGK